MTAARLRNHERGFSLIEVIIAMSVLAVGLLGLEAAMVAGLNLSSGGEDDIIARQKAAEAIESVFTARDTRTITWTRLLNVVGGGADGGAFVDGLQNLTVAGPDGLVGTADDQAGPIEEVRLPGPNGLLNDGDDLIRPLTRFKREIRIRKVNPTLRSLRVRITYFSGQLPREYVIETLISSYA